MKGLATAAAVPPMVATSITATSAVLDSSVTAADGVTVTRRGVLGSATNTPPAIGGSNATQAANGTGTGTFPATIAGLVPSTSYTASSINNGSTGPGTLTYASYPRSAMPRRLSPATSS